MATIGQEVSILRTRLLHQEQRARRLELVIDDMLTVLDGLETGFAFTAEDANHKHASLEQNSRIKIHSIRTRWEHLIEPIVETDTWVRSERFRDAVAKYAEAAS